MRYYSPLSVVNTSLSWIVMLNCIHSFVEFAHDWNYHTYCYTSVVSKRGWEQIDQHFSRFCKIWQTICQQKFLSYYILYRYINNKIYNVCGINNGEPVKRFLQFLYIVNQWHENKFWASECMFYELIYSFSSLFGRFNRKYIVIINIRFILNHEK